MSKTRTITPNPPADFVPSKNDVSYLRPFRVWCQKVLPLVYDDSLSYYELLCKVVDYLNKTMEEVNQLGVDVSNLFNAFQQLQDYVNNYFSTLDVQEEINNKLDEMVEDGTLADILNTYLFGYVNAVVFGLSEDEEKAEDNANLLIQLLAEKKQVFIPSGTYPISKTIDIDNNFDLWLASDCTLKVTAEISCLLRIAYNRTLPVSSSNMPIIGSIKGGSIDGNQMCQLGIGINFQDRLLISEMTIKGFVARGIQTGYRSDYNYNYGANCIVMNTTIDGKGSSSCVGINDQGADNTFINLVIKDCIVGVISQGSTFTNCNIWASVASIANSGVCFRLFGSNCHILNCRQDTMKFGIAWDHGDNYYLEIVNFNIFNNTSVTTTEQVLLYDVTGNDTFENISLVNIINEGVGTVRMTNSTKGSTNYQINLRGITGSNYYQLNTFFLDTTIGTLFTRKMQTITNINDFETANAGLIYFNLNDTSIGTGNGIAFKFSLPNYSAILLMFSTGVIYTKLMINNVWGDWKLNNVG